MSRIAPLVLFQMEQHGFHECGFNHPLRIVEASTYKFQETKCRLRNRVSAAEPSVSRSRLAAELSVSRSRLACGTECQLACGTECQPIAPGRSRMSDRAYRSRNQRPQAKTPKSRVPAAKRGVSRPRTADRAWPANRTCPIAHIDRAWPNAKSGVRNLASADRAWANAKPGVRDLVCETWCQPNAKPGVRDLVSADRAEVPETQETWCARTGCQPNARARISHVDAHSRTRNLVSAERAGRPNAWGGSRTADRSDLDGKTSASLRACAG